MIKYLFQIRQSFLQQNKVSIYLLHLVDKAALELIGILGVIQILNWNTNNNQKLSL